MLKEVSFGDFLKSYRQERGLSTHDIHEKTGVSQPYLSQIENGKRPSTKIINKISEGLNLNEFYLMRLAGYITEEDEEKLHAELVTKEEKFKSLSTQYFSAVDELYRLKSLLENTESKATSEKETNEILQLIEYTQKNLTSINDLRETIKLETIDIVTQLDRSINGFKKEQLNDVISNMLDHSVMRIDLLEILSSDVEINFGNKTLTELEKKRVLSVIKAIFDN